MLIDPIALFELDCSGEGEESMAVLAGLGLDVVSRGQSFVNTVRLESLMRSVACRRDEAVGVGGFRLVRTLPCTLARGVVE